MQLKEMTEEELDSLAAVIDNEGFWYAISDGGYIVPDDLLDDADDINAVNDAINTLVKFSSIMPERYY